MTTDTAWGPTGKVVYERTYSRTKPSGIKEEWQETVRRVTHGNIALVYGADQEAWPHDVKHEAEDLSALIERFALLPAGRHLWASGVKGRQYLYNCHVSGWTDKLSDHYEFTFMRLMEGGGVGANYSSRFLEQYGAPLRALRVHIVCDPVHPDYQEMKDAGLLSEEYSYEWEGAFPVEDSREGWSRALVDLIDTYMTTDVVHHENRVYDVSRVRAKGQPLRTFGGTASGPGPFAQMMHEVDNILSAVHLEQSAFIDPISAMEIDHAIAECVVSGGVRRSARMSIVSWDDPYILSFIKCKRSTDKHWTTNISVEITEEFTDALLDEDHPKHEAALAVHMAVVEGALTNGEPGYWNSSLSNQGEVGEVIATNPCTSERTWTLTTEGPKRVRDLIGVPFDAIVDGKVYPTDERGFYKTGHRDIFKVALDNGFEVEVTGNQELYLSDGSRRRVEDLLPGDKVMLVDQHGADWSGPGTLSEGYALGWLVGDGTFSPDGGAILASWAGTGNEDCEEFISIYLSSLPGRSDWKGWQAESAAGVRRASKKAFTDIASSWGISRGQKTVTEAVERGSRGFYVGFLGALFDTDGHVEGNVQSGYSVRLSSSDRPALSTVQRMLARLGIKSSVRPMKPAGKKAMPGGEYECRESFRLIISGRTFVSRFKETIGFLNSKKSQALDKAVNSYTREPYEPRMWGKFVSAEWVGIEDVYDCTIPGPYDYDGNGIRVRDCGEIALPAWGACVLGHVNLDAFAPKVPGDAPDIGGIGFAHVLMTRFLIRATYGDMNDPKQKAVMDSERRIGVGHLGVQGFLAKLGIRYSLAPKDDWFASGLREMRNLVREAARAYAFQLRIPEPVKVTTVAPTGSIAKLPGVTEGIHPIYARHYLRRVRFNVTDPAQGETVLQAIADGFHAEVDIYDKSGNTYVVTYPTKDKLVEEVEALGYDPAIVESADEISLEDLLAFQAMYQQNYADNAVSFTVNLPEGAVTAEEVASTLARFLPVLKGTTLMVDGSRPQAPYQRITREQFEAYSAVRVEDSTDADCASGSCPIR